MASRIERDSGRAARKLVAWVIAAAIIAWAAREPHQAAAVVHSISTAIANATARYDQRSH